MNRFVLTGLMALHLLLLLSQVPFWVGVIGLVILIASVFTDRFPVRIFFGARSFKKDTLVDILSGLIAVLIFATFKQIFSIESSAALVFVLLPLEMLKLHHRRSQWAFTFLWVLALALILLEYQGFFTTALLILDVVFIFFWMTVFEDNRASFSWSGLRSAFAFVLMSLPIWLVIFLFFPRFSLELWGPGGGQAELGFSEKIEPGRLEQLIANNEVALRVRFLGALPDGKFQYFRGSVLEAGEGLNWSAELRRREGEAEPVARRGFAQEVWSREINGRAMIALDHPTSVESADAPYDAYDSDVFRLRTAPRGPQRFRIWSSVEPVPSLMTKNERQRLTAISPALRERLESFVSSHPELVRMSQASSLAAKVEALRGFFKEQKFRYSLNPPVLATGGVLEFLQTTKVGFCEHFAASTVTLLRQQGVPARVAVGFLGGRPDPFSDDVVVMTREAHAWAEAYDESTQTWRRLDPTLWIEPLRFEFGADLLWLPENLREQLWAGASHLPWWPQFQERLNLAWDATIGRSERWVLTYQADWIRENAEKIGVASYAEPLAFAFMLVLVGLLASILPRSRSLFRRRDPWQKLWSRFGRRIGARFETSQGERTQWEQSRARLSEASRARGDDFVREYLQARYGRDDSRLDRFTRQRLERHLRNVPSRSTRVRRLKMGRRSSSQKLEP
ncbi:MAG: DUF3488 domain-containing protein [Bdellovibrionaceae bacterium]|nr:DUF3488 domain-containing protein [Pseudobdellovibrionaceae bacterium]